MSFQTKCRSFSCLVYIYINLLRVTCNKEHIITFENQVNDMNDRNKQRTLCTSNTGKCNGEETLSHGNSLKMFIYNQSMFLLVGCTKASLTEALVKNSYGTNFV